ncbi:pyridoxamine 5'-phosphate oxidase family protein [Subdoligranulum variabile]|uniref:pyridoxamine 5'-phosphate oxidase family protein n=1 Tax=Subdoligranulum variabile TaxID=214851 RepID=UPI0026F16354|nr:pyridoxamine 5'-phosphate oxidase family protein [Subdoligranulum variabile]
MRRKDREITDFAAMRQIVEECGCCRLGLVDEDGAAYIVPLNFGCEVEGETLTLYFHGAQEGQKITLLRQNKIVSFEMDTGHRLVPGPKAEEYTYAYRSVMGRGTVEFLQDPAARLHGLNCLMAHYTRRADWPVSEGMLGATAVFRLRVTSWTAKEHKVP